MGRLRDILDRLYAARGGAPVDPFDEDDILGVLVLHVLKQSTTASNAETCFGALLDRYGGDWARVERAPVDDVVETIRTGGLARQKAPRIQAILKAARETFGDHDLEALRDRPVADALAFLRALPGVGPHTAAFVLMSAGSMPVIALDNGILRVARRLGLVDASASSARVHAALQAMVDAEAPGEHAQAHVVLLELARETCTKTRPRCADCPLLSVCPHGLAECGSSDDAS